MRRTLLTLVLVLAALSAASPPAQGASSSIVVSQVYAGGGNAGATFTNDFVELFNRGAATVDVSGWTIQYAPAAGVSWQSTALTGSIAPGRYYLVQLGSTAAVGAALPTPNATGTTNLAASGGKLALVRDAVPLTCGATAGSCVSAATIQDLVGYGSATDYEGAAAVGALGSASAAVRELGGCTDTDSNPTDFAVAPAEPRNSSSPAAPCSAVPPADPGSSQGATVEADIQPVVAIALDDPTLSFGQVVSGTSPAGLPERVTVSSNRTAGYTLTVHRSAFTPSDLPLGISASAPSGGQLNPALNGGAVLAIPIASAPDLLLGTTSGASPTAGDVWATSVGFTGPLPSVAPGRYSATITFTVIGR